MSLLELDGVKVHFPVKKGVLFDRVVGHVHAVDGVGLSVEAGQTYGLVGESGCGKTTLGRAILRLVDITEGRVVFDDVDLAALPEEQMRRYRRRLQMVFQDPLGSLNPRQNIESILTEGMAAHGIGADRAERRARIQEILAKVGLPAGALARYPHEFSGGQRQRIGIARALVLEPDVIICDEPVSALDVSIQAQVINLLEELQESMGLTYVVIAHDLAVVRHISDVIGVMYLGSLVEEAPSDLLYEKPMHPYSRALLSAVPVPDPEVEDARERILITGDLPSPAAPPPGCRFHTRCPWRQAERCATERPELRDLGGGHKVACHYAEEIADGRIERSGGAVVVSLPELSHGTEEELAHVEPEPTGSADGDAQDADAQGAGPSDKDSDPDDSDPDSRAADSPEADSPEADASDAEAPAADAKAAKSSDADPKGA